MRMAYRSSGGCAGYTRLWHAEPRRILIGVSPGSTRYGFDGIARHRSSLLSAASTGRSPVDRGQVRAVEVMSRSSKTDEESDRRGRRSRTSPAARRFDRTAKRSVPTGSPLPRKILEGSNGGEGCVGLRKLAAAPAPETERVRFIKHDRQGQHLQKRGISLAGRLTAGERRKSFARRSTREALRNAVEAGVVRRQHELRKEGARSILMLRGRGARCRRSDARRIPVSPSGHRRAPCRHQLP